MAGSWDEEADVVVVGYMEEWGLAPPSRRMTRALKCSST
jgi:hypothetical protein